MGRHFRALAFAPAVFAVVLLFGSEAMARCIKWSDSPAVIKKNGLMKPGPVRSRAMRAGGSVISIDLCRRGSGYVYRLTVLGKKKRVRDVVIDARSGKKISGGRSGRSSSNKKLKNRIINRVKRNLRRHGINYY